MLCLALRSSGGLPSMLLHLERAEGIVLITDGEAF